MAANISKGIERTGARGREFPNNLPGAVVWGVHHHRMLIQGINDFPPGSRRNTDQRRCGADSAWKKAASHGRNSLRYSATHSRSPVPGSRASLAIEGFVELPRAPRTESRKVTIRFIFRDGKIHAGTIKLRHRPNHSRDCPKRSFSQLMGSAQCDEQK